MGAFGHVEVVVAQQRLEGVAQDRHAVRLEQRCTTHPSSCTRMHTYIYIHIYIYILTFDSKGPSWAEDRHAVRLEKMPMRFSVSARLLRLRLLLAIKFHVSQNILKPPLIVDSKGPGSAEDQHADHLEERCGRH